MDINALGTLITDNMTQQDPEDRVTGSETREVLNAIAQELLARGVTSVADTTELSAQSGDNFKYVIVLNNGIYQYASSGVANGTTIFAATGGGVYSRILAPGSGGGGVENLADLLDVLLTAPANSQVLRYNSGSSKWVNSNEQDISTKADLVAGKVPAAQLPSYVDDVEEAANFAALPVTGEVGKIYITLDDNKSYRWSGSAYVNIANPIQALDDLSDVSGTTAAPNGKILKKVGGVWTAADESGGGGGGTPGGSDRQIQFNDAGSFGGSPISYYTSHADAALYPMAFGFSKYFDVNLSQAGELRHNKVWRFGTNIGDGSGGKADATKAQWKFEFEHNWEGIGGLQSEFHLIHSAPSEGEIRLMSINPSHTPGGFTDWYFMNNIFRFVLTGDADTSWAIFEYQGAASAFTLTNGTKSRINLGAPTGEIGLSGTVGIMFTADTVTIGESDRADINYINNGIIRFGSASSPAVYGDRGAGGAKIFNIGITNTVDATHNYFSPNALQVNFYGDEYGGAGTDNEVGLLFSNVRIARAVGICLAEHSYSVYNFTHGVQLQKIHLQTASTYFKTKASAPTTGDIADGCWQIYKDTVGGALVLAANDGGVIKTVALT